MVLAHLHRIESNANTARFYCIDLAPTLFGEVTVLRRWGPDRDLRTNAHRDLAKRRRGRSRRQSHPSTEVTSRLPPG
jgi:hypothetical protein